MDVAWAVIALVTCVVSVGLLLYVSAQGHGDRDEEEAAREFFDEHGRWPDDPDPETLGEVSGEDPAQEPETGGAPRYGPGA